MSNNPLDTNAVAQLFGVALLISIPTISDIPRRIEFQPHKVATPTSMLPVAIVSPSRVPYDLPLDYSDRPTTSTEELIGELRSWNLLSADWDGEGAAAPSNSSIKEAVSFINLLGEGYLMEPMLLASGHVALYKNEMDIYSDIEFLGDGRIAYFIKRNGDKHKGVLNFNSQKMPSVFPALLSA